MWWMARDTIVIRARKVSPFQPTSQLSRPATAETAQPRDASQNALAVTEIVVTAQRRQQNLRDVPIAVTAVTAEMTQALGLANVVDVSAVTPSANFQNSTGFFQAYIRGIGVPNTSVGLEAPSQSMRMAHI